MRWSFSFIFFIAFFLSSPTRAQVYSTLWGKKGESWDKKRLPDFTKAGYKQGKKAIPFYSAAIDVTALGAVGDGVTDNTAVFRKAIRQCGKKQAIFIPAGTYLLSDSLVITSNDVCIRGEGPGKTKLFFAKGLEELYPDYNVHNRNQTGWSWSGGIILFSGCKGSGIENLSIVFPDSIWAGHDFHERSYNGIGFGKGSQDGWARNITITNADLGIWVERSAHYITLEDWVLDFGPRRGARQLNGHHGVNIYGGHNLLQRFSIMGKYQHDLSVESAASIYNVFRAGKGTDICIDHHNHAQSHNLFTNIDAGIGSRIYASGGNDTPRGICFNEVFWNIRAERNMLYCNQYDTKTSHSSGNTCVGIKTGQPSQMPGLFDNWFETIDPSQLSPADLYLAQMQRRKKGFWKWLGSIF